MKVLLVDDSKAMRMIVRRQLGEIGFASAEFDEATTGAEALERIRNGDFDLVVSDWNMPEMTGIELLEALRASGNEVPFGFVTSEVQPDFKSRALAAGARFMVAKPFTAEDLRRAVGQFT
jgi:two-component system chemotaxis response regulator CheY